MLFALAAEEARLETVALMSQWNPHPAHPVAITREHWIANNVYRWMPNVDVIHVNPGLFAFMYLLSLPMIVHLGMLPLPFGNGLNAPPSNEDIGRVAAGVLADPGPHVGRCYRPTGPELVSPQDVAEILTGVVGRKVKYRDVPLKMFSARRRETRPPPCCRGSCCCAGPARGSSGRCERETGAARPVTARSRNTGPRRC